PHRGAGRGGRSRPSPACRDIERGRAGKGGRRSTDRTRRPGSGGGDGPGAAGSRQPRPARPVRNVRPLIILRPEPGAGRTAARAARMGLTAHLCPLFEARALDWAAPSPGRFDALLLTSAQTVRMAGPQLDQYRALPAYAV